MFEGDSFTRNVFFALQKILEGSISGSEGYAYPKSSAIRWQSEAEAREPAVFVLESVHTD
eukprot:COSAG01_NODE_1801_length_9200_cov_13.641358_7_plen_60_part_00